jgi:hypothetical protein
MNINENKDDAIIDKEELALLEQRRKDRLSGKSKTYSWEEAKKAIIG